jgi:serine/threonine protein kinase
VVSLTQDATGTERACAHDGEGSPDSFDRLLRRVARCDSEIDHVQLPTSGEVVDGKYCINELLAAGGMGAVFRATHTVSGKVVALKWLLRSADRAAARFLLEARAAARVDHPNVVDVYDLGTHRGGHYLVMELLHGRSLAERMAAGPLQPAELVAIMVPLLRGVAAAHAQGVIHRDLKPENVFLCQGPDGAPREPKVLDFGISKLRVEPDSERLTSSGTRIGTPAYMSPEQLADARSVDERTDIYALGVIMYEALTGRLPFTVQASGSFAAVAAPRPPSLRTLQPRVPVALERVVLRALAPRADDRYDSIDALLRELAPFLAARAQASTKPRSLDLRGWRGALALAGLAALLLLARGQTSLGNPRASAPYATSSSVTQHPKRAIPSSPSDPADAPRLFDARSTTPHAQARASTNASAKTALAPLGTPLGEPASDDGADATGLCVGASDSRPAESTVDELSSLQHAQASPRAPGERVLRKRAAPRRTVQAAPTSPRAGKIFLSDL